MIPGFVIDTHLLRELGDLLVGRDSTAVLELIKNGYDADATVVRVGAWQLGDPTLAVLTVEDDGNGMTLQRFQDAFLRIAGRDKEIGTRTSPRYQRAYTGQKGIGRLASQKLAKRLDVSSLPSAHVASAEDEGVHASIDWEEIDRQDRLDRLERGLVVEGTRIAGDVPSGTVLVLRGLKRAWTRAQVASFVTELQAAQPPAFLMGEDARSLALSGGPLLGTPHVRDASNADPGFSIQLTGDLDPGDDLWVTAAENFSWCVEVDVQNGRVRYRMTPTRPYAEEEPLARQYNFEALGDPSLRFQARFFVMPNATARGPLGGFTRAHSGIRVYLEGFRVLPYGEYGDDWLEINRDYRGGPRYYTIDLDEDASDAVDTDPREGLNAIASTGYYGAVFLTTSGAPDLQSLINREGFVPDASFDAIRGIVQDGVRLSVRVRRSLHNLRQSFKDKKVGPTKSPVERAPGAAEDVPVPYSPESSEPQPRASYDLLSRREPAAEVHQAVQAAATVVDNLERSSLTMRGAEPEVRALVDGFRAANSALQDIRSIQPELRTLAGVGLQLGAFVHDINGMLSATTTIRSLLRDAVVTTSNQQQRRELQVILRAADELAHVLARQSSYLTDVLSTDPRRRRSRVQVLDRCESVLRFLEARIAGKQISLHVHVPPDLRTPPMFPAEVTVLLTNLLTNAVKNAANGGSIWIDGREDPEGNCEIVITNDGVEVDLAEAERWFLPFESTTTEVDEVLGQGLGLGLPIVRAITDDYRGDVRFVVSQHSRGSAVRVLLRKKERP